MSTIQSSKSSKGSVPKILTNQHCHSAQPGIKRLHPITGIGESLLIKEPIGGKKHLAMNLLEAGTFSAKGNPKSRIAESRFGLLVETQTEINRWRSSTSMSKHQLGMKRLTGQRALGHPPLEDVATQGSFWINQQIGRSRFTAQKTKTSLDPVQIGLNRSLHRLKLTKCHPKPGHEVKSSEGNGLVSRQGEIAGALQAAIRLWQTSDCVSGREFDYHTAAHECGEG